MTSTVLETSKTLLSDPDDLKLKPEAVTFEQSVATIGDLHGNAIKLLHFLTKVGVVELSDEDYSCFYDLYHTVPATKESMAAFKSLVDSLVIAEKTPFIRLIGDELADRGANDFYTLYLLKKLHDNKVEFDINQSNHTMEFTLAYETEGGIREFVSNLAGNQANSAVALSESINDGVVTQAEVDELVAIHKKHQRIISYTLSDDGITLYSHAPIDFKVVKALANKFGVEYFDKTPELLAYTIEKINQRYVDIVEQNKLHEYIFEDALYAPESYPVEDYPIEHILWNRNYAALDWQAQPEDLDYKISYVYGHDSKVPEEIKGDNIVCLDALFGKELMPGFEIEECGEEVRVGWFGSFAVENPILKDKGKQLSLAQLYVFDMPQQLKQLCVDYRSHLDDYQVEEVDIKEKTAAINVLIDGLENKHLPIKARVENFKRDFEIHRVTLAKTRGNAPEWLTAFFRGIRLAFLKFICQDQTLSDKPCFFMGSHGKLVSEQLSKKIDALSDDSISTASTPLKAIS
jgi:hypothetical protein